MKDIERLIRDLNWNNPHEQQEAAIKALLAVNDEEAVLLARQDNELCSKPCWHNAAQVLKSIGYPRIRLALPYLMEWFRDINWPGVDTIIEIMKNISIDIAIAHVENAMSQAMAENDHSWMLGLQYLINELNAADPWFDEDF